MLIGEFIYEGYAYNEYMFISGTLTTRVNCIQYPSKSTYLSAYSILFLLLPQVSVDGIMLHKSPKMKHLRAGGFTIWGLYTYLLPLRTIEVRCTSTMWRYTRAA